MRDIVYVTLTVGFFGLASAVVAACDRIVGADPDPRSESDAETAALR